MSGPEAPRGADADAPVSGATPSRDAPDGSIPGLPPEVFARQAPPAPRRRPRQGDVVLTVLLTLVLYVVAFSAVRDGLHHGRAAAAFLEGVQLATILAVAVPIALAVFSTVFSIVFLRRRVYAFWLPILAGVLVVALGSVTQEMLDNAVTTHILGG